MGEVWVEKYRPKRLDEIEGNADTLERFRTIAATGNMPHLMLAGPPGTGKTTTVLALARELLGDALTPRAVLELNASDDRGIDVVRYRVKGFAKELVTLPPGRHKIVILDEVDSMTEAAQQALRRLIEVHSDTTRFALACNDSSKVIEPIQSRCSILRFGRLREEHIMTRIKYIAQAENIQVTEEGLVELIHTAEGDMRNAINNLQSVASGFGVLNKENVLRVCDVPSREIISQVVQDCTEGQWGRAVSRCDQLLTQGYSTIDIVAVMRSTLRNANLSEVVALEFLKILAKSNFMMQEGVASELQLHALLGKLCSYSTAYGSAGRGHSA